MYTAKLEKQLLMLFVILSSIFVLFSFIRNNKQQKYEASIITTSQEKVLPTPIAPRSTEIEAPDGSHTLIMKQQQLDSGVNYSFFVKESKTSQEKEIYNKTVDLGTIISVPFNTWSPDDKYVFFKETIATQSSYFAMSADGNLLQSSNKIAPISEIFYKKFNDLIITEVTGWADPGLIVVNTDKKSGEIGPSFWFSMNGESFIRLNTRFN